MILILNVAIGALVAPIGPGVGDGVPLASDARIVVGVDDLASGTRTCAVRTIWDSAAGTRIARGGGRVGDGVPRARIALDFVLADRALTTGFANLVSSCVKVS